MTLVKKHPILVAVVAVLVVFGVPIALLAAEPNVWNDLASWR